VVLQDQVQDAARERPATGKLPTGTLADAGGALAA